MAGYKEIFVHSLDEDVKCCFCHLPLREPVQTRCGHRLCRECLEELTQSTTKDDKSNNDDLFSFTCPVDNVKLDCSMDTFPDKATERKILSLIIRCPNSSCEWTGLLGEKEKHLDCCLLLVVSCTNENCKETMVRKDLDEHVAVTCQWRMIHCSDCSVSLPDCHLKEHINVCLKYLVECPNTCGVEIQREKIPHHVENDCPLEIVSCPYAQMSCDVKVARNQVESHLQAASSKHLDLACINLLSTQEKFREKTRKMEERMSELEKQVLDLRKTIGRLLPEKEASGVGMIPSEGPQPSWKICNITEAFKPPTPYGKTAFQSEPFYSSANGYKLKVSFYPRGSKGRKRGYVSVFLIIMKGEYDDILPWPFRHKVIFTLIDQQEDPEKRRNIVRELVPDLSHKWFAKSYARPTQDENPKVGFYSFEPIDTFLYQGNGDTRCFVLDDSLLLEVKVIPPTGSFVNN